MPRRILYLLGFEIVSVFGVLARPDWGSLFLVLLLITRPQDDRPNMQELHYPMVMTLTLFISVLFRLPTQAANIASAIKAMAVPLGYFLLMFVSALVNGYTGASQEELVTMCVSLVAMFGCITFIKTSNQLAAYVGTLLLSGVYYVREAITRPTFLRSGIENTTYVRLEFRNLTNFGNPNFLALLMVLLIFVGLGFAASGQKKLFALPALAAVGGYFYVFLLCQSRGATLAFAAGLIVFLLTQKHKILLLVLATVLLGVGLPLFAPATFLARLTTITNYSADGSATERLQLWSDALRTVASYPLTGVGPGNFAYRVSFNSQHQTYLQAASELGIFGLAMLLALFVSCARSVFATRSIVKSREGEFKLLRSFSGSLYACLTALFVQGFFTGFAYREFFIVIVVSGGLCRVIARDAMSKAQQEAPAVPAPQLWSGPTAVGAMPAYASPRPNNWPGPPRRG